MASNSSSGKKQNERRSDLEKIAQIEERVMWWQGQLNLLHWKIAVSICCNSDLPNPRSLMEIQPLRARNYATIMIKRGTFDQFDPLSYEFQTYIVHELTHLIFDTLAEEHGLQQEFCVSKTRQRENRVRFTRSLEKAVEHTTQSFMKLCDEMKQNGHQKEIQEA